jgi:hypothetical protein
MVNNQYEAVLRDFETFFKCKLAPNANNTCVISIPNSVRIQIELDRNSKVLIASRLGILQGRFRDIVLREALKANEFYDISTGSFGLGKKSNNLMIFLQMDLDQLNPDKINTVMPIFLAKANLWAEGIKSGNLPALSEEGLATKAAPSPFGLK